MTVWIITDATGSEDSSSRVVFDDNAGEFGTEMKLQDGTHWFMGLCDGFADAIESM